ncbi:MAG: hypothetical protein J6C09_00540 [Clostridia bacterium]|nr:hypothetical protein [Clostridia bacterium]
MKNLLILVKMQLKEKLNFKRLELNGTNMFHILVSIIGAILKFALVTALCAAFMFVAKFLGLFSLTGTVPSSVISIIFSAMLLTSIASCTAGLTKAMYFSRDNAVLLTLPCRPIQVYLSKLLIFFIFDIKRNFGFMVPLFIAYFYTHGYEFIFYPWMLVCFIFVSLFTVSVGALLSIPTMWFCNFFRQYKHLQISCLILIVAVAISALFFAISIIPENIDIIGTWGTTFWKIQNVLNAYTSNLSLIYGITLMMLGVTNNLVTTLPLLPTAVRFLTLVGATAVLFIAGLLIVRPLFYSMASKPFEYLKRQTRAKPNKVRSRRHTAVYTEFLIAVKSSDRMFSNIGLFISIPMLTFLLNKVFLAMNTKVLGNHMIVAFNILIILLVALNANCYAASIFSRDGRSSYLIKTQPSKYPILILSKLLPNTVFMVGSLIVTFAVLASTMSIGFIDTLTLMAGLGCIYLAHLLYSAELDLMNPQYEIYATIGNDDNNPNETKSTVTAFLIAFVVAAAMLLLLIEGAGPYTYLKLLCVAFALLCYKTYVFFQNLKLYYKEK